MAGTGRDLTTGSIPRHVVALAIPAILSTLVHNLYGWNDVYFTQFVGVAAQTAVSNNLFTLIIIFGVIQLASVGTLTLVSRRTGAGNEEGADRAARQGLIFAALLSLVVSAIGYFTAPSIPKLMKMAPDVAFEAVRYLRIIFLGLPAMFLAPTIESIFRARGDARTPLLLQIIGVSTNVLGNWLAVNVFHTGVVGVAVATISSRIIWCVVGFILLKRGRVGLRLSHTEGGFFRPDVWLQLVRVSAPIGARAALFGTVYQVVSRIAAPFGTHVQNGLGVGIRVEGLCFFILVGFGLAVGPLVGQNLGAGRPDRAQRAAWTTVGISLIPAALLTVFFALAPRLLMEVFTEDELSTVAGAEYLRVISACLIFLALEVVLGQAFVGAGDTLPPMVIDVPLTAARIPLAWWLGHHLGWGSTGIWWAISLTAILRGVFMTLWFLRGKWKRARPDLDG